MRQWSKEASDRQVFRTNCTSGKFCERVQRREEHNALSQSPQTLPGQRWGVNQLSGLPNAERGFFYFSQWSKTPKLPSHPPAERCHTSRFHTGHRTSGPPRLGLGVEPVPPREAKASVVNMIALPVGHVSDVPVPAHHEAHHSLSALLKRWRPQETQETQEGRLILFAFLAFFAATPDVRILASTEEYSSPFCRSTGT